MQRSSDLKVRVELSYESREHRARVRVDVSNQRVASELISNPRDDCSQLKLPAYQILGACPYAVSTLARPSVQPHGGRASASPPRIIMLFDSWRCCLDVMRLCVFVSTQNRVYITLFLNRLTAHARIARAWSAHAHINGKARRAGRPESELYAMFLIIAIYKYINRPARNALHAYVSIYAGFVCTKWTSAFFREQYVVGACASMTISPEVRGFR